MISIPPPKTVMSVYEAHIRDLEQRCKELSLHNRRLCADVQATQMSNDQTRSLNVRLGAEIQRARLKKNEAERTAEQLSEELQRLRVKSAAQANELRAVRRKAAQAAKHHGETCEHSADTELPEKLQTMPEFAEELQWSSDQFHQALPVADVSAADLVSNSSQSDMQAGVDAGETPQTGCAAAWGGDTTSYVYPSPLLLAHRELALAVARGPPGLELEGPPGLDLKHACTPAACSKLSLISSSQLLHQPRRHHHL